MAAGKFLPGRVAEAGEPLFRRQVRGGQPPIDGKVRGLDWDSGKDLLFNNRLNQNGTQTVLQAYHYAESSVAFLATDRQNCFGLSSGDVHAPIGAPHPGVHSGADGQGSERRSSVLGAYRPGDAVLSKQLARLVAFNPDLIGIGFMSA